MSQVTVAANGSCLPASFRSFGTRHEYPHVPPQPNGILPSAIFAPAALVMTTVGSRLAYRGTHHIRGLEPVHLQFADLASLILQLGDPHAEHGINQCGLDLDLVTGPEDSLPGLEKDTSGLLTNSKTYGLSLRI